EIILAGRRLNDSMGEYVASEVVKCIIKKGINVSVARVLMLGITFKENCPDVRNTRIVDVVAALQDYGVSVDIFDPWADPVEVYREYRLEVTNSLPTDVYDGVILGVAHKEFLELDLERLKKETAVVYDVKGVLKDSYDARL